MTTTNDAPAPASMDVTIRFYEIGHPEVIAYSGRPLVGDHRFELSASLASDASPRGEAVGYIDESDLRVLARIKGQTGACRITAITAHAGPGYSPIYAHPAPAPAPADVVEGVRKAVKSAMTTCHDKGYGVAMSANAEECFVTALLMTALASPAPAGETEGSHG